MKPYLSATFSQAPTGIPTVGWALQKLLEHTARRVREGVRAAGTLEMQEGHVRWFLGELGEALPLSELTSARVHELAEIWLQRGGRGGGPISIKTLAKRLSTLRRSLRLAAVRGELDRVPLFPEIGLPPMRPRARALKTHAELRRLLAALPLERAEWVSVAVWSCQRPGDVERMRWSDIDLRNDPPTMLIRSTKTRRVHGLRVKTPRPMVEMLRARLERLTAAGSPPAPTDPVVAPWPARSHMLPVVCARIGLPPMSAIDLRHTGFSWMIRRLGLTRAAQEWGGWSDFAMLSRYYAHALPAQLSQASDELASILDEAPAANDNAAADARGEAKNDNGADRT